MPDELTTVDTLVAELFGSDDNEVDTSTGATDTGGTPSATPTPDVSSQTPANDSGSADAEDKTLQDLIAQRKAEHPELADAVDAIYKELQGGYTKKFQTLAEQRKQFEGLDANAAEQLKHLNSLQTAEQKALYLEYLAESQRSGEQPGNPEPDRYAELQGQMPDWAIEELKQGHAAREENHRQQLRNQVHSEFERLATEEGVPIPQDQRDQALAIAVAKNLNVEDLGMVWKSLNYGKAKQLGIDTAHQVRQDKQGLPGVPSATTVRSTPATNDFDAHAAYKAVLGV